MDNVRQGVTEDQYITSPIVEALVRNVHVRSSERIRNSPQRYNPGFGAAREWKNDYVASIVYMIKYGDTNSNLVKPICKGYGSNHDQEAIIQRTWY